MNVSTNVFKTSTHDVWYITIFATESTNSDVTELLNGLNQKVFFRIKKYGLNEITMRSSYKAKFSKVVVLEEPHPTPPPFWY